MSEIINILLKVTINLISKSMVYIMNKFNKIPSLLVMLIFILLIPMALSTPLVSSVVNSADDSTDHSLVISLVILVISFVISFVPLLITILIQVFTMILIILIMVLINNLFKHGIHETIKSLRVTILFGLINSIPHLYLYIIYNIHISPQLSSLISLLSSLSNIPNLITYLLTYVLVMAMVYYMSIWIRIDSGWVKQVFVGLYALPECGLHSVNIDIYGTNIDSDSVFTILPHGATINGGFYMVKYIHQHFAKLTNFIFAPNLINAPFVNGFYNLFTHVYPATPEGVLSSIRNSNPMIIYPGGVSDVFQNSCKNSHTIIKVNRRSRLFTMICDNLRTITPIIIVNESDLYSHHNIVIRVCKYITDNIMRIGIPVPYVGDYGIPLMPSSKTMQIVIGNTIVPKMFQNREKFIDAYITEIQNMATYSIQKYGKHIQINYV